MICFVCFMEINCSIVQSSSYFLLCSLYCSLSISFYIFILIVCFLTWSCTNKLVGIANLQFLFLFNSSPTPPPPRYSILYFFFAPSYYCYISIVCLNIEKNRMKESGRDRMNGIFTANVTIVLWNLTLTVFAI